MSRDAAAGRPLRADARQSIERILAAATQAFLREGEDVSLEEVARRANVGSATLHRHFPTRHSLLSSVFHDQVDALCGRAETLGDAGGDPSAALTDWLRELVRFIATSQGIAASLLIDQPPRRGESPADSCRRQLEGAGKRLLREAVAAGAVRADVQIGDVIDIVSALSSVPGTGQRRAERLVLLALDGLRPH